MDKLTREAQDHGEIFESLDIFQKLMPSFTEADIEKFKRFLDDRLPDHFKFEEEELFPVILKNGTQEEKALVQELKDQHEQILELLQRLDNLVARYGLHPSKDQLDELMEINTKIVEMILPHARKEDLKLFPILKKYEIDLNNI